MLAAKKIKSYPCILSALGGSPGLFRVLGKASILGQSAWVGPTNARCVVMMPALRSKEGPISNNPSPSAQGESYSF